MKKLIVALFVLFLMVGFTVEAAEKYAPGIAHTGNIGASGRPWQGVWSDYSYIYGGTAYYGKFTSTPTANRTWTIPDNTGTLKLNCTATIAVGAVYLTTIDATQAQCSYMVVGASTYATNTIDMVIPYATAIGGQSYTIYNGSGKVLEFKVGAGTGGSIANGKNAFYTTGYKSAASLDVFEVWEES